MELVLDVLSWALIVVGAVFSLIGGVGMIRMPDLFTRMHAASLTDTLGALGMLGGLMLQAINGAHWMSLIKLFLILVFLIFTSPVAGHALAQAALRAGIRPHLAEDRTAPDGKPGSKPDRSGKGKRGGRP